MRDRSSSTPTTAQRPRNKGFLGAAYCREEEYCHIMYYCCPLRSILIYSLLACGVLSAPTEDRSKMRIYTDKNNGMDAVKSEISKVFLKFSYKELERSRQKRMPPESYGPIETNQSSEILDMNTSFVQPSDDDDEIESQTPRSKDLVPPGLNSTYNGTNPNDMSLSSMTSPERLCYPENATDAKPNIDLSMKMIQKLKPLKMKKYFLCFTSSPHVDDENRPTTTAMTKNENVSSDDSIKEIFITESSSNNRNELENVNESTEQLHTESSDISSSTTDSTESTEIIEVITIHSSATEMTEDDNTDATKKSITKAEIKEENKAKETGMPSGVIALITAITFSVGVIIAYIGLIVWRRYLDYRYGNRELLVNDLEFDTNDLRHFEL